MTAPASARPRGSVAPAEDEHPQDRGRPDELDPGAPERVELAVAQADRDDAGTRQEDDGREREDDPAIGPLGHRRMIGTASAVA